ncbi:S-adenosyl-L-methionine-dependent methyltransferase [Mycobacterium asiaticum]|uniref:S-adenosyl-L-methionine-dependent methyltransferase n=1 Tax=Mycobacterium asiaticum TaxID=1790 RepID=A0A1A3NQL7_MYCAS|nr:YceI family protein [Mycobacterium asiaticum]OBK24176.1 S-adenosyl-L-methionine-dependent methyltransferase [Mycobacterium asiaticum]
MASELDTKWTLDGADGELTIRTGVAGRAARMGHRLTIAMTRWQASVNWVDGEPNSAELRVDVDSLEVLRGEGGLKSLSAPEKAVARSNALKSLSANRFPEIRFATGNNGAIEKTNDGYRLNGTLHIRGKARNHVVELRTDRLGDSWQLSTESTLLQSEFGVKPFSMLMGSLQVADEVTICFTAVRRD